MADPIRRIPSSPPRRPGTPPRRGGIPPGRGGASPHRAGLVALAVVAVLLMAAVVAIAFLLPEDAWTPTDPEVTTPVTPLTGFDCDSNEAMTLHPLGNGVVKVTRSRLVRMDMTGIEGWSLDIDMQSPFVVARNGRMLVVDRTGFDWVLMDASGRLASGRTTGAITGAALGADGGIALIHDEPGYRGVLRLLAPDGTFRFEWKSAESGHILSAAFDPAGGFVDVSVLNSDGTTPLTYHKRFSLEAAEVAQHRLPDNWILPVVVHDPEGHPVFVGSQQLIALSDNPEPAWSLSLARILSAHTAPGGVLVVGSETADGDLRLWRVDSQGRKGSGLVLPFEPDQTALGDDGTYMAFSSGSRILIVRIPGANQGPNQAPVLAGDLRTTGEVLRLAFTGDPREPRLLTVVARDGVRSLLP